MKAFKKFAVLVVALLMSVMSVLLVACDGDLTVPNGGNNTGDNTGNDAPTVSRFNEIKAAYSDAGYNTELDKDNSIDSSTAQLITSMKTLYGQLGYNVCFIGKSLDNALSAEMYMLIGANAEAVNELAQGFEGTYRYKKKDSDIIVYIWSLGTPNFDPFDQANVAEAPDDSGSKPVGEVVATALENLTKQKLSSVSGAVTVTPSKYVVNKTANGVLTTADHVFDGKNLLDGKIAGNYSNGEADVFVKMYDGKTGGEEDEYNSDYIYMFMRNWEVYSDFAHEERQSGKYDLYHDGYVADILGVKPDYIEKLARFNHFFVYLANAADAVTVSGNTMTVDLNKTAYSLINSLKQTINSLTPTMTVGELLRDKAVSNIISAAVNMLTPQEAVKITLENLIDDEAPDKYADAIIDVLNKVPYEEGDTTYDYLLNVISSDEAYEAVSDILKEQMDITLPAKLNNLTLNFVVDTLNNQTGLFECMNEMVRAFDKNKSVTDFASMKSALAYLADELFGETTQDLFVFDMKPYGDVIRAEVSDAKIVYQLKDGKITSMHAEGKYKQNLKETYTGFDHENKEEVEYTREVIVECTASADINFAAQKQTMTNIVLPQEEE